MEVFIIKKYIPLILVSPFLIVTFHWAIDKYIDFLFDIQDVELKNVTTLMLTMLVTAAMGILIAYKETIKN